MKILLITGLFAAPMVKEAVNNISDKEFKIDVKVLNYPIASLMTTKYIAENLKGISKNDYDYIIIPGLSIGDASVIESVTGIPTYKGTEDAYNIPVLLKALKEGIKLSKTEPADKLLRISREEEINSILSNLEKEGEYAFEINGVKIPMIPPPFRVFLEVDVNNYNIDDVEEIKKNVDVVVVGFPAGHDDLDDLRRHMRKFIDLGLPVGIDSASNRELIEGVNLGASFVFNLNELNIDKLEGIRKQAAFIVAPFTTENKLEVTTNLIKKAKEKGYEKIIGDVILSPPLVGLTQSIMDYYILKKNFPKVPMLMGFLNVTELIDADSVGINAILTSIAAELGVSCILTMERDKTRNSAYEIKKASQMISLALKMRRFPKDLGIDLLILKDKKYYDGEVRPEGEVIEVKDQVSMERDKAGYAVIFKEKDKVGVVWRGKRKLTIVGEDGLSVGRRLIKEVGEISPQHALYIGYELSKAEIASALRKTYIQDKPLFKRIANEDSNS